MTREEILIAALREYANWGNWHYNYSEEDPPSKVLNQNSNCDRVWHIEEDGSRLAEDTLRELGLQ